MRIENQSSQQPWKPECEEYNMKKLIIKEDLTVILHQDGFQPKLKPLTLGLASVLLSTFSLFALTSTAYAANENVANPITNNSFQPNSSQSNNTFTENKEMLTSKDETINANNEPTLLSLAASTTQQNPQETQANQTTIQSSSSHIPINRPNMTNSAVIAFATEAAKSTYSYDFRNYNKQVQMNQQYFTPSGWKAFIAALNKSNNLKVVESKKLVASAVPTGKGSVLKEGVKDGVYTWKIQLPLLATYESESKLIKQNLIVTMLVSRANTPTGIAISHFVAEVLPPKPITQPTAPPLAGPTTTSPSTQAPPSSFPQMNTTTPPTAATTAPPSVGTMPTPTTSPNMGPTQQPMTTMPPTSISPQPPLPSNNNMGTAPTGTIPAMPQSNLNTAPPTAMPRYNMDINNNTPAAPATTPGTPPPAPIQPY